MTDTASLPRAARFRARVADLYDPESLGPADLELLDEIVFAMDLLAQIRNALREAPLLDRRQGGDRPHPLIVEERLRASALSAALARFPALSDE